MHDRDRFERLVAVCRTDRVPDLAAALLAAGEAINVPPCPADRFYGLGSMF